MKVVLEIKLCTLTISELQKHLEQEKFEWKEEVQQLKEKFTTFHNACSTQSTCSHITKKKQRKSSKLKTERLSNSTPDFADALHSHAAKTYIKYYLRV